MNKLLFLTLLIFSLNVDAIEIKGSFKFKEQVRSCLNLISQKAKNEYKFVIANIGVISQNEKSGMRAWESPPRYQMSDTTAFYSMTWCAGTIAHDAYHSYLYKKYSLIDGREPPYDSWAGVSSEKESIEYQLLVMKKIDASDHEIKYLKSLDGTHGDVDGNGKLNDEDYKRRNW